MGTAFHQAHNVCQGGRGRWGMYARPDIAANHQDIGVVALPDALQASIRRNHVVPLAVRDALKVCVGGGGLIHLMEGTLPIATLQDWSANQL